MHRKQWIFDMDGTLTDSMTVAVSYTHLSTAGRMRSSLRWKPPASLCWK